MQEDKTGLAVSVRSGWHEGHKRTPRKDQLHGAAPEPFQGAGQLGQRGCPAQAHGLAILPLLAAVSVGVILVLFSLCILLIADVLIICRCQCHMTAGAPLEHCQPMRSPQVGIAHQFAGSLKKRDPREDITA